MWNSQKRLRLMSTGFALAIVVVLGCSQSADGPTQVVVESHVAEAGCGICQLGMEGDSCELAVRIDGKAYYVDGSNINDHGDAHAADGLCNTVRKATVAGIIENGRFTAKHFTMLPAEGK